MPTPNVSLPGFAEAIAAGCLCPVNPGWKIGEQSTVPVRCDCPLHGREAWEAAVELGRLKDEVEEQFGPLPTRGEAAGEEGK